MRKGFLYIFFSHTDFFPTIQIFLVIYTDFVLDQSGRSEIIVFFDDWKSSDQDQNSLYLLFWSTKFD